VKTIEGDARRYAWCRSHALWIIGVTTRSFLEDAHGARQAGQKSLLRFAARMIGETCAVAVNVALNRDRPIPDPTMRSSWALERLQGHELWQPCWELIRGVDDVSTEEIVERCETLVAKSCAVVGEMPNPFIPEGTFPAIAFARDWIKLMDVLGEESPMPHEWILPP
jgi:hypothetical protein